MTKERDYSYEALAEATNCDMEASRGELNVALKSIRAQAPELSDYALADEIHRRAKLYRDVMGDEIMITPTALSKHWVRVLEESRPRERGTNKHSGHEDCATCGGDRFVVVGSRPAKQTMWMREHGIVPREGERYIEVAACFSCNHSDYSYFRYDGSRFRAPDPEKVRELMSR